MNYHENKKDRERRRKKLCEGMCEKCEKYPSSIPWKGKNLCYKCFTKVNKED